MFIKARTPAETFPAAGTFVRFLSCVNPLMPIKVWSLNKALLADGTLVGFLSCVNFLVVAQSGEVTEAFPTVLTLTRLLSRVNSLMFHEVWTPPEAFSAGEAMEVFLSGVSSLVKSKLRVPIEGFPTLPAGGQFLDHGGSQLPFRGGLFLPLKTQHGPFPWVRFRHTTAWLLPRILFLRRALFLYLLTQKAFLSLREILFFSKAAWLLFSEEATLGSLRRRLLWGATGGIRRLLVPLIFQVKVLFVILLSISWKKRFKIVQCMACPTFWSICQRSSVNT